MSNPEASRNGTAEQRLSAAHLTLRANVPSADASTFSGLAAKAKAGCPVSRALNASITLDAALVE